MNTKPQAGSMPDEIFVGTFDLREYHSDQMWSGDAGDGYDTRYIRAASIAEGLDKLKRGKTAEHDGIYMTEYSNGWNAAIDAIRDSMIKEAGLK